MAQNITLSLGYNLCVVPLTVLYLLAISLWSSSGRSATGSSTTRRFEPWT